jgi:MFS superfamily sulfate permease-like transporter
MLPYFLMMPLPTVAAILCKVAVRLMDVTHMTHMLAFDRAMFWIAVFTAGASFFLDTTVGLAGGSLISLLLYAKQMSSGQCEVLIYKNRDQIGELDTTKMDDFKYTTTEDLVIEDEEDEAVGANDKAIPLISLGDGAWETKTNFDKCQKANLMVYQLFGKLNYINDRSHVGRAKKLAAMAPECKYVVFCFKALTQIDLDGVASFGEMVTNFERANIQVGVAEILNAQVLDALNEQKYFEEVKAKGLIFDTLEIAVQKLSTKLEAEGL